MFNARSGTLSADVYRDLKKTFKVRFWCILHNKLAKMSLAHLRWPSMVFDFRQGAALVIAHPGHELSVYGWLERARSVVFILTDGSGQSGTSRLDRTATLISQAGLRYQRIRRKEEGISEDLCALNLLAHKLGKPVINYIKTSAVYRREVWIARHVLNHQPAFHSCTELVHSNVRSR